MTAIEFQATHPAATLRSTVGLVFVERGWIQLGPRTWRRINRAGSYDTPSYTATAQGAPPAEHPGLTTS